MDLPTAVAEAARRIAPHVRRTPVEPSSALSAEGGASVTLKLENLQRTGSFKLRGAMNKLLSLGDEQRARGVCAASTGNHGMAVACGAAALGCRAVVFAPTNAHAGKLAAIRGFGAEVRTEGEDCVLAEAAARAFSEAEGCAYVSPYNDPDVVAGQGTCGLEMHEQLDRLDAVFLSVGGGGLVSGIGGYLKSVRPDVRIVGCSPRNSAVMHASLEAGRILDLPSEPTLSDGTAGGVEADAITFELCREVIDEFVLVDEDAIAAGVRDLVTHHHTLVEGAAGTAVAGYRARARELDGAAVAIVLCGANIDAAVLKGLL